MASLQREMNRLKTERDLAIHQGREWQLQVGSLKAELDRERGSYDRILSTRGKDMEKEMREDVKSEWGKSEAAWKERIRNERLLRLSYERVLINLGFAPSRIASDLVRVSRPQPMNEDPAEYRTPNLLDLEAGVHAQPASKRSGLFSYSMNDIKSGMKSAGIADPLPPSTATEAGESIYALSVGQGRGKRDLLRSLAAK